MPSEADVADVLLKAATRTAARAVAPVASAYFRGYVAEFDAGLHKASIRKGTRDAQATPGFDVPPALALEEGDYVLCRELGANRVVVHVLDRNASVDSFVNPLTSFGQIIIAGEDGIPTVIEPPEDPTLDYALQWDGATQRPVWVELP